MAQRDLQRTNGDTRRWVQVTALGLCMCLLAERDTAGRATLPYGGTRRQLAVGHAALASRNCRLNRRMHLPCSMSRSV